MKDGAPRKTRERNNGNIQSPRERDTVHSHKIKGKKYLSHIALNSNYLISNRHSFHFLNSHITSKTKNWSYHLIDDGHWHSLFSLNISFPPDVSSTNTALFYAILPHALGYGPTVRRAINLKSAEMNHNILSSTLYPLQIKQSDNENEFELQIGTNLYNNHHSFPHIHPLPRNNMTPFPHYHPHNNIPHPFGTNLCFQYIITTNIMLRDVILSILDMLQKQREYSRGVVINYTPSFPSCSSSSS